MIVPISSSPDALVSALGFLRDSPCTNGSQEGGGSEWEVASHQWGLFISWAYNRGVALPTDFAPTQTGGREHDLIFDETGGRWLKFTRPFAAGDTVVMQDGRLVRRPATPREYLRRWLLCNRFLGDDVELVGLSCFGRTQRIVVSQRHLAGRTPGWDEVERAVTAGYGMRRLPDNVLPAGDKGRARGYCRGRLAVFEVRPENFVRLPGGEIKAFDVIPQLLSGSDAAVLAAASR